MKKICRSFICILSFSLVLASVFSIGANAVYFTFDNIPVSMCQYSSPQSVFEVVVNDGSDSFAVIQSATAYMDKIKGVYLFGVPVSVSSYDLYALVVLDKSTTNGANGSWIYNHSSVIRGSGLNFYSAYSPTNSSSFEVGYTGSNTYYSSTVLFNYRIIKLNNVHNFTISDITHTNFQMRYGYIDSNGEFHWQSSWSTVPDIGTFPSEAKNLLDEHYSDRLDLRHNGVTTTMYDTLPARTPSDSSINITIELPEVTGDGFGGEVNTDDFSKLDDLIEDLTDLSADMSSNLGEMSDQFARVRSSIDGFISNVPGVIVACIVCAMIILIAVKIIGR